MADVGMKMVQAGQRPMAPRPTMRFSGARGMGGSGVPATAASGPPRPRMSQGYAGTNYAGSQAVQNTPLHNRMGQMASAGTDVNAVQQARMQGPDPAAIQAEMKRRQMGAGMGPQNAALSGYMMG
jgi:hypothetical protein